MEKSQLNFKGVLAEVFGTLLLVLFGAGIASRGDSLWTGSIAFGLILMGLIVILGPISGGHFNPAVSIGLLINKKIDWKNFLLYILAQFVGATIGGALLLLIFSDAKNIGANGLQANFTSYDATGFALIALLVELIATFVFVLTIILTVSDEKLSKWAVFIIPSALTLALLMAGAFTGGSVNPARSFGTMIYSDLIKDVWVVIVGPVVGAVLAGLAGMCLLKNKQKEQVSEETAH